MYIVDNFNEVKHLLVDARLDTDDQIADVTGLSRTTVRIIMRSEDASAGSIHQFLGKLLREAAKAKKTKSVNAGTTK